MNMKPVIITYISHNPDTKKIPFIVAYLDRRSTKMMFFIGFPSKSSADTVLFSNFIPSFFSGISILT